MSVFRGFVSVSLRVLESKLIFRGEFLFSVVGGGLVFFGGVLPRFSLYGVAPHSRNCSKKIIFMSGLLFSAFVFFTSSFFTSSFLLFFLGLARGPSLPFHSAAYRRAMSTGCIACVFSFSVFSLPWPAPLSLSLSPSCVLSLYILHAGVSC